MESLELKNLICEILDENLAQDITILDVQHLTVLTDFFVICTAKSTRQVNALTSIVEEKVALKGVKPNHHDGIGDGKWSVLDYGGVILHVFNDETRMFYCLEKLWSDGDNMKKYNGKD